MRIVAAHLTGFRNLADLDLAPAPGVNLLLGGNGQGKTNLLEALHFMALGRSHRGARHDDLVAMGAETLHVALTIAEEPDQVTEFEFGLERGGGRRIRVDGHAVIRRADLVGRLAAVYFDPDTVRLVREGPEHRRRFVDRGLSQIDAPYLTALSAYHRALRQKTAILRDVRRGIRATGEVREELQAWNQELARQAVPVVLGRAEYAARLGPAAAAAHRAVTGDDAVLEFVYRPQLAAVRESPQKQALPRELARDICSEFDYIWPDELRRGRPLAGPQRDDFSVRLEGRDLRTYGSQGETRTAAVALILGQSEVVHLRRRVRPVLFLDDIFSELDRERARRLQELAAREHQLFVATARPEDVAGWRPPGRRVWNVAGGVLTEREDV